MWRVAILKPRDARLPDMFERRLDAVVSSTIEMIRDAQYCERGRYVLGIVASELLGTFRANRNRVKRHRAVTTPVGPMFILPLSDIEPRSMRP